ncbi:MAG: hypothetical protein M0036_19690 [Desulfobacteraceae bacterium]|nr:hypothetical protein [Desulfobacteraceae bacterium]
MIHANMFKVGGCHNIGMAILADIPSKPFAKPPSGAPFFFSAALIWPFIELKQYSSPWGLVNEPVHDARGIAFGILTPNLSRGERESLP